VLTTNLNPTTQAKTLNTKEKALTLRLREMNASDKEIEKYLKVMPL
jgi:hypothetical protein